MNEKLRRMTDALRAVKKLHASASRLLMDCDGTIGKNKDSVFGSYVTRDMTWNVNAPMWMAEGVYRYYRDKDSDLIEGITISFIDKNKEIEPTFILGVLDYHADEEKKPKGLCSVWDIWDCFYKWCDKNERKFDQVLIPDVAKETRIQTARIIAVPLFDVSGMQKVEELHKKLH